MQQCIAPENLMRRLVASCILSLVLSAPIRAQDAPPVSLSGTQQYDLKSTVNGREYRLYVALPAGYVKGDTTRYPVLYVLDGHFAFPATISAREYLGIFRELEDVIIVGIGEGDYSFTSWFMNRWRDYTPSADSDRLHVCSAVQAGGRDGSLRRWPRLS